MYLKCIIVLSATLFAFFGEVSSTGFLLNALKNTVQTTRCNLHKLGSSIISHGHRHGDPCGAQPHQGEYGQQSTQYTEQYEPNGGYEQSGEYGQNPELSEGTSGQYGTNGIGKSDNGLEREPKDLEPGANNNYISKTTDRTHDSFEGPAVEVTSERLPSSLDIDIRMASDDDTSTKRYKNVPEDGGRNIIRVNQKCPDGYIATTDGCLEEI